MTGGWDTFMPFAGARPPEDDSEWDDNWDSRTKFIVPILNLLKEPVPIVCIEISGHKGLGKSSIIDFVTHIYGLQQGISKDQVFKTEATLANAETKISEISSTADKDDKRVFIVNVYLDPDFDFTNAIPLINSISKQYAYRQQTKTILVLERIGKCEDIGWPNSNRLVPPLQINHLHRKTMPSGGTQSVPQSPLGPPQWSGHKEGSIWQQRQMSIRINESASDSISEPTALILRYTKGVGPLAQDEVDTWFKGHNGEIHQCDPFWESRSHSRYCDDLRNEKIRFWAGRNPTLLRAAVENCCEICHGGGTSCNLDNLNGIDDNCVRELLKEIFQSKIKGPKECLYWLNQFGLVDAANCVAGAVEKKYYEVLEKKLMQLLRDVNIFSIEQLQKYWQDFSTGDDLTWDEIRAKATQNGSPQCGIADALVRMCIRHRTLEKLMAEMREHNSTAMDGIGTIKEYC